MFNLNSLFFGGFMATIDLIILTLLRAFNLGWIKNTLVVPLAMLVYSFQPVVFLRSLKFESLTVMNLMWDVMSDIGVTAVGLFYFKEKISKYKKLGVLLSVVSIILLSYEDGEHTPIKI
jgi:drug/metabolite transporter (DMT)-like permease